MKKINPPISITTETGNESRKGLLEQSANKLLDDFGSGRAAPGSGSAAALMGILSGKLITTVCSLTLDKVDLERLEVNQNKTPSLGPKFLQYEKEYNYIISEIACNIEPRLKQLFEDDAKQFEEVIRLRKESNVAKLQGDSRKKSKLDSESKDLLEKVTLFVFEMAEQCIKLISHGNFVFDKAYPAVKGDSGAAISSAIAGVTSCIFIINLNLKSLGRRKFAKDKKIECDALYDQLQRLQAEAFSRVGALSGEALESIQKSFDVN